MFGKIFNYFLFLFSVMYGIFKNNLLRLGFIVISFVSVLKLEVLYNSFCKLWRLLNLIIVFFLILRLNVRNCNVVVLMVNFFGYSIFSCNFERFGRFMFMFLVIVERFRYKIFREGMFRVFLIILNIFDRVKMIRFFIWVLMSCKVLLVIFIYCNVMFVNVGIFLRLFELMNIFCKFKVFNFLFVSEKGSRWC